jgi:hypothetical protein
MIDRNELEDQMLKNLAAVGMANVAHADSIGALNKLLDEKGQDYRGIVVTMIHKFRDMPAKLNARKNIFVLIDEAQNCTYGQLKMLLTRLGWHSTMVMTGDPDQTDLLPELSGLGSIAQRLEGFEDVAVVRLRDTDVVRHPLVGRMLSVL